MSMVIRQVFAPRVAEAAAASHPACPAPITITSYWNFTTLYFLLVRDFSTAKIQQRNGFSALLGKEKPDWRVSVGRGYYLLSWLSINTKEVVWKSPFHQTVRLQIEKCNYVGIADFAQHNRGLPVVRGDEISYIYLSTEPLPSKYCHRIDATKCKHGFIKFAYSDKLCQELISVLPEDKTKNLVSFYNRMQASDRINKLKQKKKRKKKN